MTILSVHFKDRLLGRHDKTKSEIARNESSRSLSQTFKEHQLDLDQIAEQFPYSKINVKNPAHSTGLSKSHAAELMLKNGRNSLTPPQEISNLKLFLRQFLNLFWILLIGAAALSFITYTLDRTVTINLYTAIILIIIVLVMCIVTYFEEKKAINVVRAFKNLLPTKCSVIRDGMQSTVDPGELVNGDIVVLKNGSRVPADVRILQCSNLKLETSSITGEPEPIKYHAEAVSADLDVFDAANVAFNGSFCVEGDGIAIVIRTGEKTVIGRIASLTSEQNERQSTLEIEINRFVRFVFVSAIIMATVVFLLGCITSNFTNVLSLLTSGFLVVIIANVPQGLPATVTSELTIIARRMAKKNVFMKRMNVVDALGATTVIASDKTGTLTTNYMTVTDAWTGLRYINGAPEVKHKTLHSLQMDGRKVLLNLEIYDRPIPELITVMTVCNKAHIEGFQQTDGSEYLSIAARLRQRSDDLIWHPTERSFAVFSANSETNMSTVMSDTSRRALSINDVKPERLFTGMPSEVALLRYADKIVDTAALRNRHEVVYEVPFNSVHKYHLVIIRETGYDVNENGETKFVLMLKGAPEMIIAKCSTMAMHDEDLPIDEDLNCEFQDAYDHFGNNGRRVIGFARREFMAQHDLKFNIDECNFPFVQLTFLGLVGIMDPPRPETAAAIQQCKKSGIKVFMVTGDHASTATAIAREIGLIGEPENVSHSIGHRRLQVKLAAEDVQNVETDWAVVNGKTLVDMDDRAWNELLGTKKYIVFARTTPEQKLLIVEQCQMRDEIVCVTGDGVNDAPALKKADIGVAMGITGSDVAKQAADVILMDDNFASIVNGIEEGRLLFDNLRKTIAYTLAHTIPEVVPIVLNFLIGVPMAITSLQILSIDLGTEITPAISLAFETAERDIMSKPPRKRHTRLVSLALLAYSYIFVATITICWALGAYSYVYMFNGIAIRDLVFSAPTYFHYNTARNFTSNGRVFDVNEQITVRNQAAAAYYLTLVITQAFHIWMCTTRRTSFFRHGITNVVVIYAVIIETLLVIVFIYVPGFQFVMGASPPPRKVWLFPVGAGICIWIFNETRKYFIRKWPYNNIVRLFKW